MATGTGIAPFVSYARAGVAGYVLLHGVRTAGELYYRDILASAASLYVPCISGARRGRFEAGAPGPASHAYSGRVTGYVADLLEPGVYDFYLCGRSDMIVDAVKIIDERFPGSFVYTEPFF